MQDQATVDAQLALSTSISMEETTFSQLNVLHVWIKPELDSSLVQTQNIQFGSSALLVLTQVGLTLPLFSFIQQKHKSSQLTTTYYP